LLNFVFGRSGFGKTEYVFRNIKTLVENGEDNILLITPEQYSLVAERRLLTDLGESKIACAENCSFSRMSNEVKHIWGSGALPVLSKGAKAVIMMQAIDKVKDALQLFNRHLDSISFVNSMVSVYDEMRSCNLSSSEISDKSASIKNDVLMRKMNDISLIMTAYENLIENRFLDPSDELTRLYNTIADKGFFKDKTVFIDGFNGFVAQEYKILELIINESKNVTVTLCTDSFGSDDNYNLFSYVNNSAAILEKIAKKSGVNISYKQLKENYRAQNDELRVLENNIFSADEKSICSENGAISLYSAKSISDECSEVSRQIKKLLRNGYKAEEITVITRDLEKYRDELSFSFRKYGIPFFKDERQSIKTQPVIVFCEYLLRCVNYSFRSEDILSLAKTGLTSLNDTEISELENYIYLWNINGMKWTKPFENSAKGFTKEITHSDQRIIDSVNISREKLIKPLITFKNAVKGADTKTICTQIYYALVHFGADEKLKELALNLDSNGLHVHAQEQGVIWDMLMEILNQIYISLGSSKISLKDFARLFSLVISTEDLGTLPAGIDNIQIGQADRIRTDNPRAVFILGANEGEFPQSVSSGGILTENDRRILLENDFKLYSYSEILNIQEKYFAYMACCAPKEKLFVSYLGNTGKESAPSEIVTCVKMNLPNVREYNYNSIEDIDLIESIASAFDLMSERYFVNTPFYSSLKKYFENDTRFSTVKALAENEKIKINDASLSAKLFNYDMLISASRIEDYFNCPFRYFCKFGLSARPRKKAEIDPMQRGTLIHYVLEMILSEIGSKNLSLMSKSEIINQVDKYIADYFIDEMGNVSDVSDRFKYNYRRLSRLIYSVVFHLAEEFSESEFQAEAFELGIDKDGEVKPEVIALDDGGTVQIRGSIDRVDTFAKNGDRYVRVVDYKSGNKKFSLSDVMYGLNLQMFVYLFSLCSDKSAALNGIPAGVLYMHSARSVFTFDSKSAANGNLSSEESSSYKMKGIVLGDSEDVVRAMEKDLNGKYIPVTLKKNGGLSGSIATLAELGNIHKKINLLIAQMGNELHQGNIVQSPVKNKNHKQTCDNCDYADVCANRRYIEENVLDDFSDSEVKEKLAKEFEENA